MENITIKKSTIEFALDTVNKQYSYIKDDHRHSKTRREKQLSYYQGMATMLDLLMQQGFTDDTHFLWIDPDGTHSIKRKADIK